MNRFKLLAAILFVTIINTYESKWRSVNAENVIKKICIANFNAQLSLAGKKAPGDMADFTCDCFLTKINKGSSIDLAQQQCKNLAFKEFEL